VAKLLPIPLATVGLAGAIGFWRLPSGWVAPSFHAALAETVGPVQVAISQAQIRWGGWRHPLGVSIRHVMLTRKGSALALKIPSLLLSLKMTALLGGKAEIARYAFESAQLYDRERLLGEISGTVKKRGQKISLRASFQNLDVTALIHLSMGKARPPSATFPFRGTVVLEGNHKVGATKLGLSCESEGGTLAIPEIYPHPFALGKVRLSLEGNGQNLTLTKANLKRGESMLAVRGTLHTPVSWKSLYEEGGIAELSLEGKGVAIPVDDLTLLWPHGLAPKPRQWVVQRLSKGQADSVTTHLRGVVRADPRGKMRVFEVPDVHGQIDASGVVVDYFGNLPPVVGATGTCRFTRQQFTIEATGVANGIQLKTAKIVIEDTHLKDQTIDILLGLEGPVRNSLEIIDAAPLLLARKLGLEPTHLSGGATTSLHLRFPLATDTPLEFVHVNAKSQIRDGEIFWDTTVNGVPVKLDQGDFALEVSQKSLEMKGQGRLQGVGTQILWQEYFNGTGIPFQRRFVVEGNLGLQKLKNFGLDVTGYLAGEAKARVQYTSADRGAATLEGFVDLTPAIMVSPVLFWQKEQGKSAHLIVKGTVKGDKGGTQQGFVLGSATLVAPDLTMVVEEKDDKDGKRFEVNPLKIGNSHLRSTIFWNPKAPIQATVQGRQLDLSQILEDSMPKPLLEPDTQQGSEEGPQGKVKIFLDRVHLGKNNEIHQVSGEMFYRHSTLRWAHLKGKAPHNGAKASLDITPLSNDRQQFTIKAADGGHLLEVLGAGYDIEEGGLVIEGIKSERKRPGHGEGSWEMAGTVTLDDFTINRAPLLARLLSAASLHGIVNFFSGKGIHFHNGSADFSLTPEALSLKNVRLTSPSLGLNLNGSVDRLQQKVHFTGELIPLYIVNTLLARMPLVGAWISGGREEGIFLTQFALEGDRKNPTLTVNPVTTVTPGLVREFLASQG